MLDPGRDEAIKILLTRTKKLSDEAKVKPATPSSLLDEKARAYRELAQVLFAAVAAFRGEMSNLPSSAGYGPFLTLYGMTSERANASSAIIKAVSFDMERNAARMPAALKAIRFLAVPRQSRSHIKKQVQVLIATYEETTILQNSFSGYAERLMEFLQALRTYEAGDHKAYEPILSIAATMAPKLSIKAGPKPKAETFAHLLVAQMLADVVQIKPPSYTWSEKLGECCDPMTEATRREFNNFDFDSRPACRIAQRNRQRGNQNRV